MESHRKQRLAATVREELEEIINYELSDPRINPVSISDVQVSSDGKKARVLVTVNGEFGPTLEALEHARSFLRTKVAERLNLFRVPDFHFEPAVSPALGGRVEHLMKRIRKGRPRDAAE